LQLSERIEEHICLAVTPIAEIVVRTIDVCIAFVVFNGKSRAGDQSIVIESDWVF
jgi:hypothetical protein